MSTFVAAPFPSSLSLVEYRKVCSNTLSRSFQSKRRSICGLQYTSTALMTINRHNFDPTVYLVTDRRTKGEAAVEDVVRTALLGNGAGQGVTFVQYVL